MISFLLKISCAREVDFSKYSICSPASFEMRKEIELAPIWMAALNFRGESKDSMY